MTGTFIPGGISRDKPDAGYALLRTLAVMFIIILCFAAFLGSLASHTRREAAFLRTVVKEIQDRDEARLRTMRR